MNTIDLYYIGIQLGLCILLFVMSGFFEKYKNCKWKLLFLLPLVLGFIMLALGGFEKMMILVYFASIMAAVGFILEGRLVRRIALSGAAIMTLMGTGLCLVHPAYRSQNYLRNFEESFAEMQKRYVLSDYKQIDWDALHDRYASRFQEATVMNDEKMVCRSWMELCAEFYDGHVNYSPNKEELITDVYNDVCGRDFGLSILNLSDGRAVAVNVDDSLSELGIHNGTIITSWSGMDPAEAAKKSKAYDIMCYPDADNAYFFRSLLAAGVGSGEITFIDDNGNERSEALSVLGKYSDRVDKTIERLNHGYDSANLSISQINDTTACLRIKTMMYDAKSYADSDYTDMKKELKRNTERAMKDGAKDLIIDLRDNSGGSGSLVRTLAELYAPEGEHFYCYDGVWDRDSLSYVREADGTFRLGERNTFSGEDILNGGHIVILVNQNSISAADHLTAIMSGLENVTVMGFTESNGSGQGVSMIYTNDGILSLSASVVLGENGLPRIDSSTDRQSEQKLDIQVPFTQEAAIDIFDNKVDYLMNYALDYLAELN